MRAALPRLIGLAALLAALLPASPAAASQITSNGSTVTYTAAPGESNSVLVSYVAYDTSCGSIPAPCLSVFDSQARMTSVSGGCELVSSSPIYGDTAVCSVPTEVVANLGDRDDAYWGWNGPNTVDGGAGNDNPITGAGATTPSTAGSAATSSRAGTATTCSTAARATTTSRGSRTSTRA